MATLNQSVFSKHLSTSIFNGSLDSISSITELENSFQVLPTLLFTDKVFNYNELELVNLSEDTKNKNPGPSILDIAAASSNSSQNRTLEEEIVMLS